MPQKTNILLFSPVSSAKDYALVTWLPMLYTIVEYYKNSDINLDVLLIDNSKNPDHIHQIAGPWQTHHIAPQDREIKYFLTQCQEYARQYAISKNYDYILSLECDIHPPVDVLHTFLLEIRNNPKIKVIAAKYPIGIGIGTHYLIEHTERTYAKKSKYVRSYCRPVLDAFNFIDNQVKPVYGCGIGCMLIAKQVYTKIPFRVSATETGPSDKFFNKDLFTQKIKIHCATGIHIKHDNTDWNQYANYNE